MAKTKLIPQMRVDQPVTRTAGDQGSAGTQAQSGLRQGRLATDRGAQNATPHVRRGMGRRLVSLVLTARYHLIETVFGLSEEQPPPGRVLVASVARALGFPAPRVTSSVTVGKPREEVLRVFRYFEEIRRFMRSIERAEIVPGEETATIGMRIREPGKDERAGLVSFAPAPGNQGTEVKATLAGVQPAGRIARAIAKMVAATPKERLRGDLRRMRQWIVLGEIPTTSGQPSGRKAK